MPVSFLSIEQRENYGRYGGPPSPHDLARYFHLDDTDHALIAQKRGTHNRLGFAVQLVTVRYLGTFLEDPLVVPTPVLRTLAKQLRIEALHKTSVYSTGEQRWQHATEIRTSYGYVEFTEPLIAFRLTRWLYALCWTGTDRPTSDITGPVPVDGDHKRLRNYASTGRASRAGIRDATLVATPAWDFV